MLAIIVIGVLVYFYLKSRKAKIEAIERGDRDDVIRQLIAYYDLIRSHKDELNAGVITVGTFFFLSNDKVDTSSAYLAVQVRDETGSCRQAAADCGLDIMHTPDDTWWYQYPVRVPFNGAEKKAIIQRLAGKIATLYPNDVFETKDAALFSMVDSKEMMEMINRINSNRS